MVSFRERDLSLPVFGGQGPLLATDEQIGSKLPWLGLSPPGPGPALPYPLQLGGQVHLVDIEVHDVDRLGLVRLRRVNFPRMHGDRPVPLPQAVRHVELIPPRYMVSIWLPNQ